MICLTCCIAKWGEFPEFPHLGKLSFKAVENFIKEQNKQLSPVPLRLEIYSPDVVDLRLVDLPGLIHVSRAFHSTAYTNIYSFSKNPTRDQPADMRERIKELCSKYIDNKKTVVSCIV